MALRLFCAAPGGVAIVGVDALIDPTAKRPKGSRADVGIRPYKRIRDPRRA